MRSRRSFSRSDAGFGLVETLIALAIIAIMTALTFEGIAVNARSMRAVSDRRAAVLVAKSALDAAIGGSASIDVPRSGTEGAMRWQVAVERFQPRVETAPPLDLVTVTVDRDGSDRPLLRLRSLRIGR